MNLLKKAPAPVPGCGSRPEDGPQSDLFSGESTMNLYQAKTHISRQDGQALLLNVRWFMASACKDAHPSASKALSCFHP